MSSLTEALARQIVRLDVAIRLAYEERQWGMAQELDEARQHVFDARWSALREEWAERKEQVA